MASGTSAIHMALKAVGVEENDIVFCSALTFSASTNPIRYEKGIPVLIDSEPKNWNMSPNALQKSFAAVYAESCNMRESLRTGSRL